jgi:hypothetical protein
VASRADRHFLSPAPCFSDAGEGVWGSRLVVVFVFYFDYKQENNSQDDDGENVIRCK